MSPKNAAYLIVALIVAAFAFGTLAIYWKEITASAVVICAVILSLVVGLLPFLTLVRVFVVMGKLDKWMDQQAARTERIGNMLSPYNDEARR